MFHPGALFVWSLIGCTSPAPSATFGEPAHSDPPGTIPTWPATQNYAGSHTTRVTSPCTLYVSPSGSDADPGTADAPIKTSAKAASLATPGSIICFAAGSYPALNIYDLKASAASPAVFRTMDGAEQRVTFGTGNLKWGHGVLVRNSDHVHLYDLRIANTQTGISFNGSSFGRIEGVLIESMGQAAIHLGRDRTHGDNPRFITAESHHLDVIGNHIRDTGLERAKYGEGVYIGTGGIPGDETHHTFVAYNRFEAIRAEAIELKPGTSHHIVRGNLIKNSSHEFHAAITVAVQKVVFGDAHFLVEDNIIYNFRDTGTSVAGITVGHGNGIVRNNVIWGIEGGRGIRTTTTFANPSFRDVLIENNTIWTPGSHPSISLHDGDERTGMTNKHGLITLRANRTNDGSEGSTKVTAAAFVGPISGSADAGDGDGSGFQLKDR